MENNINSQASHLAPFPSVTQNRLVDNTQRLTQNLVSVSMSSNALPAKKEPQPYPAAADSRAQLERSTSQYSDISDDFDLDSNIKDNVQYHSFTKERFKALRQYINEFTFPDDKNLRGSFDRNWYFTNYIQKFELMSQKSTSLSFDPAGKKILNIFKNHSIFKKENIEREMLDKNMNLEPKDHGLLYPEKSLDLKDCFSFRRIIAAIVEDLDADILKCEENEHRLYQSKH
ncbi:hypothetical protein ABK905_03605 [Acerihabitans sp. KWT182]|uniref:Uncharacterized protein n=1 Tax=Acerihabitans sp. KWT182 TaxID=3157919 RepID=A0AAU7QB11_9GAMM